MGTGDDEPGSKPVAWLHGQVARPPFSKGASIEAGHLLWRLQLGEKVGMPHARPMPSIGPRCLELRISDGDVTHRIICRVNPDAVLVGEVFTKKMRKTPDSVIDNCKRRFAEYDRVAREASRKARGEDRP